MSGDKNKPAVFIASTIFDFEDLRSALKHWLEEQGYEVLLSEANDFPVDRSTNSYQACLDAIARCDYFLLLIGSRVGGLFDQNEGISITRKEYRVAYELAHQDKIRIITFVRQSVWSYRHSQKELEKYLRDELCAKKEIHESAISRILNRPSDFATQAELIVGFIDEVARIDQMKEATVGNRSDRPASNWIHSFSTFSDVIDSLKIEFAIDDNTKKKLAFLLEKEICENLTEILIWYEKDGCVLEMSWDGDIVRPQLDGDSKGTSLLNANDISRRFFTCWLFTCTCSKMSTRYISQSIDSGVFLKYNRSAGKYEETKLSKTLWLLRQEIDQLKRIMDSSGKELYEKNCFFQTAGHSLVEISNKDLALLLSVSDRRHNIICSAKAVLRAINGKTDLLETFVPKPSTPFPDIEEDFKKTRPDEERVIKWALDD